MEISEEDLKKKLDEAVANATKGLLTQEQLNEIVQKRLSEKEAKHKAELEEVQKTAKMSAEEKQKHDFENLTKERDELKGLLAQKEHSEGLARLMNEKKIGAEFSEMFSGISDLKTAGEMMDKFNAKFTERLNAEKEALLNPHTPKENISSPKDAFEQGFDEE